MKNVYIENLGCAKNQTDAEQMLFELGKTGWKVVFDASEANLIIVNTCGFLESAKKESLDVFFSLKDMYPNTPVVLAGCLAERYSEELGQNLPEADAVFGNKDVSKIADAVEIALSHNKNKVFTPSWQDSKDICLERRDLFNYPGSAYLKISEGCNHRCSYCAIPVIRGNLKSIPQEAVLKEAKRLVSSGIKEINLIAQDLAAYGTDLHEKSEFCALLEKLCAIPGDFNIRLLYIHPDFFPYELLDLMKKEKKILHYLDLPMQHCSQSVLKNMNRFGSSESYLELVQKIRKEIPDIVIRTTLMTGFPGETEEDFEALLDFVKKAEFNWMGSFVYSREENTPAYDMTTEEKHIKLAKLASVRRKKLENLQSKISEKILSGFVGNEYDVLIEEIIEGEDLAIGRIYAQAPDVDGHTVVIGSGMKSGQVYRCGIRKVNGLDLEAVLAEEVK